MARGIGCCKGCAILLALGWLLAASGAASAAEEEALPALGATIAATSVSGLSSGAYMAGQIEVAHASEVVGAGIVAGGPFGCAESAAGQLMPFWPIAVMQNAQKALNACMNIDWGAPDPASLADRAKELAEEQKIDALQGLADDKIYLFSGDQDQTVKRPVVEAAKSLYEALGVPPGNIELVERAGGHAFLTEEEGSACQISATPYLSDCDYDQAKAILEWIYGPLAAPSSAPRGRFISFDQSAFASADAGLAQAGVAYIPPSCSATPGCRVHVVLHGCEQAQEVVGDELIRKSGFAELADTNRLVILFPQVAASAVNPHGCWDWWGYTGLDYLGKDAPQIKAVWAMVEQLAKVP